MLADMSTDEIAQHIANMEAPLLMRYQAQEAAAKNAGALLILL